MSADAAAELAAWLAPRLRAWQAEGGRPQVFAERVDASVLDGLGWRVVQEAANERGAPLHAVGGPFGNRLVGADEARRALADGHTLQLEHLQDWSPTYRALAGELGWLLGGESIRTNVYVSPPEGEGFDLHHDQVEVAVVQLEGRKHWQVFETRTPDARSVMWDHRSYDGSPPILETVLEPGQVLCMRAGQPHLVRAVPAAGSMHISVGVHPIDGVALLDFLRGELVQHEWLRAPMPWSEPTCPDPRRVAWIEGLRRRLVEVLEATPADAMLDRFLATRAQLVVPPPPLDLREALDRTSRLTAETPLRLVDPRLPLQVSGRTLSLLGQQIVVESPAGLGAVLELLGARARPVTVATLAERHGLDVAGLVALARRLLDLGALRIVDDP